MRIFDYETKTTFWTDFSIAERFLHVEPDAIQDTYDRAFNSWKDNTVFVTELAMILNWKMWYWYEQKNNDLAMLYCDLYEKTDEYCINNLKGDDLKYYYRTTD